MDDLRRLPPWVRSRISRKAGRGSRRGESLSTRTAATCVVVGVVVVAPDDLRPVYLDPMWDEVQLKVLRKFTSAAPPRSSCCTSGNSV